MSTTSRACRGRRRRLWYHDLVRSTFECSALAVLGFLAHQLAARVDQRLRVVIRELEQPVLAQRDRAGRPLRQERRGVIRDGERGRGGFGFLRLGGRGDVV